MVARSGLLGSLAATAHGHSQLIYPKPRNAIDSLLPEWADGKAPHVWEPFGDAPCACRNGTEPCASAQTCLWFSVGCSIGCAECDGGDKGGANPGASDRCGSGMKATVNDPLQRTLNRDAVPGSDADWTKFNPWRAPGHAPVFDPCGVAGGGPHATPGKGEYDTTKYAKLGDLGSNLPKMPSGAVWKAGSVVQAMWSLRANHGGGYQYRLCPLKSALTEACFQETPVPFAGDSSMMMSNGTMIKLNSTFVTEGTLPVGGTWQMNPVVGYMFGSTPTGPDPSHRWREDPCDDHTPWQRLGQGICTGEWIKNITMYDQLRVPENLEPGEYVLGFRWDCETSAQIWQSCADVTITAADAITV